MRILLLSVLALASACVYRPVTDADYMTAGSPGLEECERIAPTGTRLGKVTCLTPEAREALAEKGRDDVERMQRSARGATKDSR